MPKNYLIGIGGTGARVLEAVLQCCAAGFGPSDLTMFLVDPDDGNGNLNRTTALVAEYRRAREAVAERAGDDVRLFGTKVDAPDPVVWSIFRDRNMTLGRYVNLGNAAEATPEIAQLMEVLFSREELDTRLNQGFRGHPSIGAVVMANRPDDAEPWKSFWADVQNSQGEGSVRVFLVGSIFGGTGAAGVPTFGAPEMLKWAPDATMGALGAAGGAGAAGAAGEQRQSKVFLGAALVLPYFTVDLTTLQAGRADMFVTPADFPAATKAALQYYSEQEATGRLAYDQVYLLGDSLAQPVGDFHPGDKAQKNRPHYVEVAAALAAFDFFEQDPTSDAVRHGPRFFATGRNTEHVDWRALPVTRDAGRVQARQAEFERRVAVMAVFAYAFNTLGLATLDRPHKAILETWYQQHYKSGFFGGLARERDPRAARPALDNVATYNANFLAWLAALDGDDENRVRLVDRTKLFAAPPNGAPNGAEADAAARPALFDPEQHPAFVGALLKGADGAGLDFNAYRNALNAVHLDRADMPAASRYVNLFYEAALRFVADNWRLAPPAGSAAAASVAGVR